MTDQDTQDRLEEWYEMDGRHDPDHPMHCLYSGLMARYGQTTTTTEIDDCAS